MLGFAPLAGAPLASAADNTRTLILAGTEAKDAASFVLDSSLAFILAATEAQDTASFDARLFEFLYLQATEAQDTANFVVENTTIELIATEVKDVAAFVAAMSGSMAMSAVEAQDGYSQNLYILWLEPTQPDDPSIWVPKNDPAPYLTTVI